MTITLEPASAQWIRDLVGLLAHKDPAVRLKARSELVHHADHNVTRALVAELIDPLPHVRWEAAKSLAEIADPVAAHGLMHALDDDDKDVRWVAAEGLIALGNAGLVTVLSGLTRRARSIAFCRSAHHVLHELRNERNNAVIDPVLAALDTSEPEVTAPPEAFQALLALKRTPCC
jgi:HEAT repeat protein